MTMIGALATGVTFARNFWPHIAIIAAAAFALGNCTGWKATQLWYRGTVAALETTLADVKAEGRVAQARVDAMEKAGASIVRGISDALDQKIAARDARHDGAIKRLSSIRLCRDAGGGEVPAATGAADADDGGAGSDRLPSRAGADSVGSRLGELAIAADENTDRLEACQAYVRDVLNLLRTPAD